MRSFAGVAVIALLAAALSAAGAKTDPSGANGRAIFLTGRDANGVNVGAAQRPAAPACAACHRANGAGGVHVRSAVSADLRHAALVGARPPYSPALLERAIATGVDNAGKPLDPAMPRWHMSKRDLHDVAHFVWTQLK